MGGLLAASAIVLAGGRSSRFGSDKMIAEVDGQPLFHHAIRGAAAVCEEVLVATSAAGLSVAMPDLAPARLRVVLDEAPYEGPLAAFVHAATSAAWDRLLVVGGDMPDLQESVLRRLLAWPEGKEGVCLTLGGQDQPMPIALARATAVAHGARLLAEGARSLRALVDVLDLDRIPEAEWRELDPRALSLRDIDRPDELSPLDKWVGSIDADSRDVDEMVYGE